MERCCNFSRPRCRRPKAFGTSKSESPAPYYWIIVPDQEHQRNRFALGIPVLGSIWLTHSLDGRVDGLKNTPRRPSAQMGMVFYGFRVMYIIAILMFGVAVASLWLRWQGRSVCQPVVPARARRHDAFRDRRDLGGWYLAETGRQPWVI